MKIHMKDCRSNPHSDTPPYSITSLLRLLSPSWPCLIRNCLSIKGWTTKVLITIPTHSIDLPQICLRRTNHTSSPSHIRPGCLCRIVRLLPGLPTHTAIHTFNMTLPLSIRQSMRATSQPSRTRTNNISHISPPTQPKSILSSDSHPDRSAQPRQTATSSPS